MSMKRWLANDRIGRGGSIFLATLLMASVVAAQTKLPTSETNAASVREVFFSRPQGWLSAVVGVTRPQGL